MISVLVSWAAITKYNILDAHMVQSDVSFSSWFVDGRLLTVLSHGEETARERERAEEGGRSINK